MAPDAVTPSAWTSYFRACLRSAEAVQAVESVLAAVPSSTWMATEEIRRRAGHGLTLDHVAEILSALSTIDVGSLDGGRRWLTNPHALSTSLTERVRVRQAVSWTASALAPAQPTLLVSTPRDATAPAFSHEFGDLRTTLRSIIAGSQRTLILASPFWDLDVADDLAPLLAKRLDAGVHIRIVARDPQPGSPSDRAVSLIGKIAERGRRCEIRILDKPSTHDPFGRETFHFKMVGADGSLAYIGSANFDTAGLASRWELGVLLRAGSARTFFDLVNALADSARLSVIQ